MGEMEGLAALEAALAAKFSELQFVGDTAMEENAIHLEGECIEAAPIDEGDLRGSITHGKISDGVYEVGTYGQGIKALVQHERLDFNHPKGGGPKYIERPFAENIDRYVQHVADAVKGAL